MAADKPVKGPLARRACIPCQGGVPPLAGDELAGLQRELGGGWEVVEGKRLEKQYKFPDFQQALRFTDRVGALAESVGHHPEIVLAWGRVKVKIWTHKIGGLSEADFVLAARVDALPR